MVDVNTGQIRPGLSYIMECVVSSPEPWGIPEARSGDGSEEIPEWYTPGVDIHSNNNAFLLEDESTLLFETLSPINTEAVVGWLRDRLDDRPLDYLVVSHTEAPHAGNADAILRAFPEATLVGSGHGSAHDMYHLEEAMLVDPGDTIDLGQRVVEFHPGYFGDTPRTIWMTERTTGAFFTADWFGIPHVSPECGKFVDQLATDVSVERLKLFHQTVIPWMRYAETAKVEPVVDHVIETLDPSIIAPTHGLIIRENPRKYLEFTKEMLEAIESERERGVVS